MQKECFEMLENHLGFVEDVVDLWKHLFDLMESVFFLHIMQSALDIHNL